MKFGSVTWYLITFALLLMSLSSIALAENSQPAAQEAPRERLKVGLALSGGGAKGAAHVGVLKVLEEHRIPVDYIAGTSIGSYVGGLYAIGYSAAEIEALMLSTDWNQGFSDAVPRESLPYRDKIQRDIYNVPLDLGIRDGEFRAPSGYLRGQTMAQLVRYSVGELPVFDSFDDLAIPYRAIATDLETREEVILDKGDLVTAMLASMTVPGVLNPVEREGRLLVDGGLVNNMPVQLVKDMGADIVIAVDIGAPLLNHDELNSAVKVLEQLANFLTQGGLQKQIALMEEDDVLIVPALHGFGTTDFSRMRESIPLGRTAAEEQIERLEYLALPVEEYQQRRAQKQLYAENWLEESAKPVVRIRIHNSTQASTTLIRETLDLERGQRISADDLNDAINRVYALNRFERVDAEFIDTEVGRELHLAVKPKPWGPNYLDFGLSWEDNFDFKNSLQLDASFTMTDINHQGAYWRTQARLGENRILNTEFYQPFDLTDRFYARAQYRFQDRRWPLVSTDVLSLDFDKRYNNFELGIGTNYSRLGILEIGALYEQGQIISRSLVTQRWNYEMKGGYLAFGYDSLNSVSFPTQGNQVRLAVTVVDEVFTGAGFDGSHVTAMISEFDWKGAIKLGNSSVVGKVSAAYTDKNSDFTSYGSDLGGFLNLSGFLRESIVGPKKVFGALIYQYDLGRSVLNMTQYPLYLGASLEAGNVWQVQDTVNLEELIYSGSLFVGTDTQLGPAALGFGAAQTGDRAVYLFIGRVF
ncbi:patatin-like phospholipase family protein [Paraferrimonas sedimenticola]|uniref:patatin-like phospholipase family protein n=1 Tax=Paraferrimonas sedimenticola TaxID=375674 RepID=UPI001FE40843|nr:patatin-like phospholipase family protein [Paraferrimonas sedimenticola]